MKRFLFAVAVAAAFFSAPQVQAQTGKKTTAKPVNTSVAPATPDDWGWNDTPAAQPDSSGWEVPGAETAAAPTTDPMMESSGVMLAPGMNTAPYRGTSTDYNGRPVVKPASKRPRSVEVAQDDPMMQSSGVMLAPGMNTAPYRRVSTDYNGRPLRKPATHSTVAAQAPADNSTVAAGW